MPLPNREALNRSFQDTVDKDFKLLTMMLKPKPNTKDTYMSKIIGLIGFKQVGKSTAAKYLEDKYGFVRHNMKDALVAEIKQNFPDLLWEIMTIYNEQDTGYMIDSVEQLFVVKPPLMRALLQNYGTEVRRRDDDDYWVHQWIDNLPDCNVVADDVRFINEGAAVEGCDGILIRLTRPDITTGGSHPSETEQLEIEADYTIECQPGGHEELYRQLDGIIGVLK